MEPKIASRGFSCALAWALVGAGVLAAPERAHAQSASTNERAQVLFDEGRELMKQGRFSEACAKLAESQLLDPGGGTLLNLGICRRREGRTATAFQLLGAALEQARSAGRSDRVATAERHLAELAPLLSKLVLEPPATELPPDAVIELDGKALSRDALTAALPVDPGDHELRVTRPGYEPFDAKFTLGPDADIARVTVPELSPSPPAAPDALAMPALPPAPAVETPAPVAAAPAEKRAAVPVVGYVLLGTGGALLVTGTYFGIHAFVKRADSDRYYDGSHCTAPSCVEDWHSAQHSALISTVTLAVGTIATGAGLYLVLARPRAGAAASNAVHLTLQTSRASTFVSATGHF